MVDGCQSKLVNVVSGLPQGSVFGLLLFLLFTSELLMAVVPSPGVRVTVAESLFRDLGMVSE